MCAECGTLTTVPFRPTAGRPVYCRPCFQNHRRRSPVRADNRQIESPTAIEGTATPVASANFEGMALCAATRTAIAEMNITEPTPIQARSIPHLLAGEDLIGQARTGSGKTLAFAIPLVERCEPTLRQVQALVLVPTRELAIQVATVTETLASSRTLRVKSLYGGRSIRTEQGGFETRCSGRCRNAGTHPRSPAPGQPRTRWRPVPRPGRSRRDARQGLRP